MKNLTNLIVKIFWILLFFGANSFLMLNAQKYFLNYKKVTTENTKAVLNTFSVL